MPRRTLKLSTGAGLENEAGYSVHRLAAETTLRPRYQDRGRKTIRVQPEEGVRPARLEVTEARRRRITMETRNRLSVNTNEIIVTDARKRLAANSNEHVVSDN
jgi:hypothetical protein